MFFFGVLRTGRGDFLSGYSTTPYYTPVVGQKRPTGDYDVRSGSTGRTLVHGPGPVTGLPYPGRTLRVAERGVVRPLGPERNGVQAPSDPRPDGGGDGGQV